MVKPIFLGFGWVYLIILVLSLSYVRHAISLLLATTYLPDNVVD